MRKKIPALLLILIPTLLWAHPGHIGHGPDNFFSGLLHPVTGIDHLLAMVAVGVWATCFPSPQKWALPIGFVSLMTVGFFAGMAAWSVPYVELMIAMSVLILGLMITFKARFMLFLAVALVGLFGFYHGFAHGTEFNGHTAYSFAAGFILATALLHIFGIFLGNNILGRNQKLMQATGLATSLVGLWLIFAS